SMLMLRHRRAAFVFLAFVGFVGEGVLGDDRGLVVLVQVWDNLHRAVHLDPVAGVGAEEGVVARFFGGGEAEGFGFAGLDKLGGLQHLGAVGDEGFDVGVFGGAHGAG